jgi:PhnB protein
MAVKPVPDGYHTVTPYLTVSDADALLDFIKKAFGAKEFYLMRGPDGKIGHADLAIGDSHVMLGQAGGQWTPMPAQLYLYVPDCDAVYGHALTAGATSVQEPKTQFYGDRHGCVKDACGNLWWVATHVEDVPMDELERRAKAARPHRPERV